MRGGGEGFRGKKGGRNVGMQMLKSGHHERRSQNRQLLVSFQFWVDDFVSLGYGENA